MYNKVRGKAMILNASGRCDVIAYYSKWLIVRIKEGYVDVRNPFYPTQVSRIEINPSNIDLIVFCTKNPLPIMKYLDDLDDYPCLFQVTITPYQKELEPNVPDKKKIIDCVKRLSNRYNKDSVIVRYDPILLNEKYNVEYHKIMFERLCAQLHDYIDTIIISFIDMKKNTTNNAINSEFREMTESEMKEVSKELSLIAKRYDLHLQTCAEKIDLTEYGILQTGCLDIERVKSLTNKYKKWPKSSNREGCNCVKSVDIGAYNACAHYCKYCYANYDEKQVNNNMQKHNPDSSLILGQLTEHDIIKIRKG